MEIKNFDLSMMTEPMSVKEIARGIGASKKETKKALKELERHGLILPIVKSGKKIAYYFNIDAIGGDYGGEDR